MKTPGVFIAVLAMYCICALCIGISSAADTRADTAHHNSTFSAGPGHWLSPDAGNVSFPQKNFNESAVKPAPRHMDNSTGAQCPGNFPPAHPVMNGTGNIRQGPDLTNVTQQQQIISRLEKDGVDVTELTSDFQNGNTEAARTWLDTYFRSHKPAMGNCAERPGLDLTNATQQQQIISRLEKDGFNVTDFKTELLNGNIDAVKALLDAFMQAHRNTLPAPMERESSG
jgi:hypothetical protein